ncbi:alpha-glucosidase family protein [Chitinivorax sp. B]|uniref:alpha-glucosidase family protein n=1 Tax=Chitinivorax sp. B TaxID=2502235 RepID=UPI0010F8C764|nr:alpha-glucosidase family protein [Chitinivorax sp. B]
MTKQQDWWRSGVIYQIYPRSFFDSNGDGIGDLPGITQRLDYVAELGVDAIWLSPFFTSPMKDFGYDVSDYRGIDPMFGTLADFDQLITKAHALGLKVLIDQVISHSSDQHPWFQQSRQQRDGNYADWYVWADAKADGSPPNNWLSLFGGSAWQWDSGRQQYYLHNFLASQPDLNLHNPSVRAALLEDMRFWLDRGVDGFRLDTVNFYFHDAELRDNPPWTTRGELAEGVPASNPYALQHHLYDKTRPENLGFLRELRTLLDQYGAVTVGEIGADDSIGVMADYTSGHDKLHMAYSFHLLTERFSAMLVRDSVSEMWQRLGSGWVSWSFNNHDNIRVVTRWRHEGDDQAFAKLCMALLLSLKGTPCLYQGEELGLPEAHVPFEQRKDPYGLAFGPSFITRDGCRTGMPWQAKQPHAGFSTAEPWLPIPTSHLPLAVDQQLDNPDSVLSAYRRFLAWRKRQPALLQGELRFIDCDEPLLMFERQHADQHLLCVFNLGHQPRHLTLPALTQALPDHGLPFQQQDLLLTLPGYGVYMGAFTD